MTQQPWPGLTWPLRPMLARPGTALREGWVHEPKWDGFRALVLRDGDRVEIASRNERPLTRYFPELVEAFVRDLPERVLLDGEIVLPWRGRLEFELLGQRVHPAASRIARLADETPTTFVAFDLVALGTDALLEAPTTIRRERLVETVAPLAGERVRLTPQTADIDEAMRWFGEWEGAGLDGLVSKDPSAPYSPDQRTMAKLKHVRTADCVVAGVRPHKQDAEAIGSLMLGVHDDEGRLLSMGVMASFPMARRRELWAEFAPLHVTPGEEHPWAEWGESGMAEGNRWNAGKDMSFVPVRPERVVEAKYDHLENGRFRHTTQFVRWRPDRDPRSCTVEQFEVPVEESIDQVWG